MECFKQSNGHSQGKGIVGLPRNQTAHFRRMHERSENSSNLSLQESREATEPSKIVLTEKKEDKSKHTVIDILTQPIKLVITMGAVIARAIFVAMGAIGLLFTEKKKLRPQ